MAVRLLQWLAGGGGVVIAEKLQSFEEAANAYAREGGFVDWARQCLFYWTQRRASRLPMGASVSS